MRLWLLICAVTSLVCSSAPAQFQHIQYREISPDGTVRDVSGPGPQSDEVLNYDNWRVVQTGGQTRIRQIVRVRDHEVGDDLRLVGQVGQLDSLGFSMSNLSLTDTIGNVTLTFRFRRASDLSLLGSYTVSYFANIPPNTGSIESFPPGTLRFLGISLEDPVLFSLQWTNIEGVSPEDVGQYAGSPHNVGSSGPLIYDLTAGGSQDLGADNLLMLIRSYEVPSPSAIGFVFASLLLCPRRSRPVRS